MDDLKFGTRDARGHYSPNKVITYPPVFVWPLQPLAALRWVFAWPGYFLLWNAVYLIVGTIVWFCLSPPLDQMANPSLGWIAFIFLRNSTMVAAFFGAFHVRLYVQRKQGTDFKFNPRWPATNSKQFMFGNQTIDNMILTFASGVTIWTAFEVGILWLAANNYINVFSPAAHPIYFAAMILTVHLWRDLHFYLVHRLIHWAPLYRLAHRIHHKNTNPGPWSGLAMHPVEHLLYFSCALIYLVLPFHPLFAILSLVHAGLSPAPGHTGFDRVALDDDHGIETHSYAHYLHHKYFECNYADGVLPLDRWFGTFHDGTAAAQDRMKDRLKEKSLARSR